MPDNQTQTDALKPETNLSKYITTLPNNITNQMKIIQLDQIIRKNNLVIINKGSNLLSPKLLELLLLPKLSFEYSLLVYKSYPFKLFFLLLLIY